MKFILFCLIFSCTSYGRYSLLAINSAPGPGQSLENESSDCNYSITGQYGTIRSPGYPSKYPRYSRCQYVIERFSPDTCEVKLTIEWFEVAKMTFTNCSQDYFEIQDGNKKYKLCGELPSGSKKFIFFPPGSNKLVFKFRSTFHQKKGFLIEVKQLPFSCAENMIGNNNVGAMTSRQKCSRNFSGRISRITYPDYTEDNVPIERCTYTIRKSGAGACLVQLDLSSFDFVQTPGCSTDYLLLPNGQKLCGVLGGSRKFIPFPPGKDSMILELSSTSSTSNSFDIQVTQLPGPCEEPFGSLTGIFANRIERNELSSDVRTANSSDI